MNHPRHDFLARAGGPEDQHRDVRLGRGADPLEDDSIFSSRPIISRKRCTDGAWSSSADVGAPLEEGVEQAGDGRRAPGGCAEDCDGLPGSAADDAEFDELA